jgi:hypothetical protein
MKYIFNFIFFGCLFFVALAQAKKCTLGSNKKSFTKTYVKKTPYAGLGKRSSVNGLSKYKPVSGHGKRTSRGYTYVNSYARSK